MVKIKNSSANSVGLLLRTNNNVTESKNRCNSCNHQLFKITDDGFLEIKCKRCKDLVLINLKTLSIVYNSTDNKSLHNY